MKVILFLAAVYALIINVCHQKKTVFPLPSPVNKTNKALTSDTISKTGATTVKLVQTGTMPQLSAATQLSTTKFSW